MQSTLAYSNEDANAHRLWPLSQTTIAAIRQDRWQIERFFNALQQRLKIMAFVGTAANPVKTPIGAARICCMLTRYRPGRLRFAWSLSSNRVGLLRMNLFTHRDLHPWMSAGGRACFGHRWGGPGVGSLASDANPGDSR